MVRRFNEGGYVYHWENGVRTSLEAKARPQTYQITKVKPTGVIVLEGRCRSTITTIEEHVVNPRLAWPTPGRHGKSSRTWYQFCGGATVTDEASIPTLQPSTAAAADVHIPIASLLRPTSPTNLHHLPLSSCFNALVALPGSARWMTKQHSIRSLSLWVIRRRPHFGGMRNYGSACTTCTGYRMPLVSCK